MYVYIYIPIHIYYFLRARVYYTVVLLYMLGLIRLGRGVALIESRLDVCPSVCSLPPFYTLPSNVAARYVFTGEHFDLKTANSNDNS